MAIEPQKEPGKQAPRPMCSPVALRGKSPGQRCSREGNAAYAARARARGQLVVLG